VAVAGAIASLQLAAAAIGAPTTDPLSFHFAAPASVVDETAGWATVTVERSPAESLIGAQVRYITSGDGYDPDTNAPFQCGATVCTATSEDFASVKGELDFRRGQTSASFTIPIVDHGVSTVPKTLRLSLFGPSTGTLGAPSTAVMTILEDDPTAAIEAGNPLGLAAAAGGDPLAGARFFVDPQSPGAIAARTNPALEVIAREPGAARFGTFSYSSPYVPNIGIAVSRYLARAAAEEPGSVPLLATHALVHGVRGNGDSPAQQTAYHNLVAGFAQGIGSYRGVLLLEMDAIITMPGLNRHGQAVREHELADAINVLSADCPRLVIYLDAGAADALHARDAARFLRASGVAKIEGFLLNATHFDWTSREIRYGNKISSLTGGKHFIVNTGENGRGPLRPRDIVRTGNEVLCNPVGRGLGPKPTTHTGYPKVDMFAWTSNPGESGGQCDDQPGYELRGAPPGGEYWPAYALMLVHNARFGAG
jgi:endoglucanase